MLLPSGSARHNRILCGVLGGGVLLGTLLLSHVQLRGPVCLFRAGTGLPCPGCGMTRSLEALWHGHLLEAFQYHPMGVLVFAGACLAVGFALAPSWYAAGGRLGRLASLVASRTTQYFLIYLFLALWVLRLLLAISHVRFFRW